MSRHLAIIGAPSSAAGHWPGMEKAPAFLRRANFPERLRSRGAAVTDYGDLPLLRWRPDPTHPLAQNVALVAAYVAEVANSVDRAVQAGTWPILVGGECTLSVGALSGLLRSVDDLGIMYLDGHVDLNTPNPRSSGILDAMGVAHMLGLEGTDERLSRMGSRFPLLTPEQVVLFGHNEHAMDEVEVANLALLRIQTYPVTKTAGSIAAVARSARTTLEGRCKKFWLHFDVDVICFSDFPIADVPIYNEGLSFEQAIEAIEIFAASPQCIGLAITEINPDHANENLGDRFADAMADALVPAQRK
jgi:arginase